MKTKSYVFLFILLLVLVFILGVRYGQKVELTNKIINLSPTSSPTPTVLLEFKKYQSRCGVSFLYPATLGLKSESSTSALLVGNNSQIALNCEPINEISRILDDKNVATAELSFQSKKIQAKNSNQDNIYVFKLSNIINGRTIFFAVQKNLYPLLERTLEFKLMD